MHTDTVRAQLHRLNWLLRARVVEAKLRDLKHAVKAGFDPNQPRVPAGSGRTSGQWPMAAVVVAAQTMESYRRNPKLPPRKKSLLAIHRKFQRCGHPQRVLEPVS